MIKQWTNSAVAIFAAVIVLSLGFPDSASAYGGSWGSSRGGFGSSGGSWGGSSGGLLAGRKPVRNLLGIVGGGISAIGDGIESLAGLGSGGSSGSSGGMLGGGRFGDRFRRGGSSGGWSSTGSSTGSFTIAGGASSGSTGRASWSSGLSYGSCGGLYAGAATENYYGDWGSNYLSDSSDLSYPINSVDSSYPIGALNDGVLYGSIEDAHNTPVSGTLESYGVPGAIETGFDAPILDYGASQILNPSFNNTIQPQPGSVFGPIENGTAPGLESGFGDGLPDAPIPDVDADSTGLRSQKSEAVLSLKLPREARVYINGKLTTTQGSLRQYVSRNLTEDKDYRYRVKAVVEKDGRQIVRTQLVRMRPGKERVVRFNFNQPQVTTLVLRVPEDAEVLLDGKATKATGKTRTFSTRKLSNEQSWNDYKIEVRYTKDGQPVIEQRSLDLVAGTTETIAIGGESNSQPSTSIKTSIVKN